MKKDWTQATRQKLYDPNVEKHLIGVCIVKQDDLPLIRRHLTPADFYDPMHAATFTAICKIADRGEKASPLAILSYATQADKATMIALPYLYETTDLLDVMGTETEEHARYVKELADVRSVYERMIALTMRAGDQEPQEWLANVSALTSTLPRAGRQMRTLAAVLDEIDAMPFDQSGAVIPTGLPSLDRALGGGLCGAVSILGGRPGMGKSALAAQLSTSIALSGVGTVMHFCMEMKDRATVERIIAQRSGVALSAVKHGHGNSRDVDHAKDALRSADMKLLDLGTLTVSRIRAEVIAQQSIGKVALVVVDYLQQLASPQARMSKREAVSANSNALLQMSRDLEVPCLLLAQLNRDSEKDKSRPRKIDLKESGDIEQDAECIMFVWQPFVCGAGVDKNEAEILIDKQRNGVPTALVPMRWEGTRTMFIDPMWRQ